MRTAPRISVITVALNDLVGIKMMVHSLQEQDYPDIEHVLVDGASTDGTLSWLESYAPSYANRWVSEKDRGIFDAMNKGASLSTGDLMVFMNAGDSFSNSEVLSDIADLWKSETWRWAYGQMQYVDNDGAGRGFTKQFPHAQRSIELGTRFAPHQATYVSRDLFDHLGGFDLSFDYACDQEFAIRAGQISEPYTFGKVTARFLEGGVHSQTTYWRRERIYHRMRIKNDVLAFNSLPVDRTYTEAMALYREIREFAGALLVKVGLRRSTGTDHEQD
ncbi:MAG: glycosyltransferase family 2 protein [Actinomycetaceae bacterium]|nr:glycosyltransferase family 2 protein [Actinomycetaceae bacterium]